MKRKGNYSFYENAAEAYLIQNNVPFIATDETRRSSYNDGKIKSFDLIIPGRSMLLVDLKGRKFGYMKSTPKNLYENWIHQADADGLTTWSALSAGNQKAYLVFAYMLPDNGEDPPTEFKNILFHHDGRVFAFMAITIEEYLQHAKRRSYKPLTVSVSRKVLKKILRPFNEILIENKI